MEFPPIPSAVRYSLESPSYKAFVSRELRASFRASPFLTVLFDMKSELTSKGKQLSLRPFLS